MSTEPFNIDEPEYLADWIKTVGRIQKGDLPGHPFRGNQWTSGMSGPMQERAAMVAQKLKENANRATDLVYEHNPNAPGAWSPERQAIHDQIIAQVMAENKDVPNDKQAIIMGGLGGSGKTSLLTDKGGGIQIPNDGTVSAEQLLGVQHSDEASATREGGTGITNYMNINADDIKERLLAAGLGPQVEGLTPMETSSLIHEESSYISRRLGDAAAAEGKNMIWDVTLGKTSSGVERIDPLKAHGYTVRGVFVDVTPEHSATSAMGRYERGHQDYLKGKGQGGRYVPPEIILSAKDGPDYRSQNRQAFEGLKPHLDSWTIIDNEGYRRTLDSQSG